MLNPKSNSSVKWEQILSMRESDCNSVVFTVDGNIKHKISYMDCKKYIYSSKQSSRSAPMLMWYINWYVLHFDMGF